MFKASVRRCACFRVERCRWRRLSACHSVDHVVAHYDKYVRVSSCRMHEVAQTYADYVSISAEDYHVQVGPNQFYAGGRRNASSMQSVNRIRLVVG